MRVGLLIIISIFLSLSTALADSVHVKDGNVYYENNGKELQITSSGRDRDPVLHPDGTWVYFVRKLYECPTKDKCIPLKGINIVAAEENGKGIGRIRLRCIPDATKASLHGFIKQTIEPGTTVTTDGLNAYRGMEGYVHARHVQRRQAEGRTFAGVCPSGSFPFVRGYPYFLLLSVTVQSGLDNFFQFIQIQRLMNAAMDAPNFCFIDNHGLFHAGDHNDLCIKFGSFLESVGKK